MVTRRKFAEAAVCGFARSLWGILGTGSLFRRTSGLEEAKILDYWLKGDLILVKRTNAAENGQVIVALTEEGNTLKRLFWEDNRPRLHAENKKYKLENRDIYPKMLAIQGIAIKVIKDIH